MNDLDQLLRQNFLCARCKGIRGVDVQLHSFLSSAPGAVSGQLHVPAALSCAKSLVYPLSRRLGEPESECGRFEKRYQLPLPENEIFFY